MPVRQTDKDHQHDLRELAEDICELTKTLLAPLDGSLKFLGVGVEIGGHVHRGVVRDSVHAGWSQPVPLQEMLTELLGRIPQLRGVPTVVENDVNALAMHGYYEGSFKELDVTLVTVFRQGVGGALIRTAACTAASPAWHPNLASSRRIPGRPADLGPATHPGLRRGQDLR